MGRRSKIKWSKLPTFEGGTALQLMQAVKKAVLAEPKRMDMATWIDDEPEKGTEPACHTQGCIGGWMVLMTEPRTLDVVSPLNVMAMAMERLPESLYDEAKRLFTGGGGLYPFPNSAQKFTKIYAQKVAVNIDRFITRNKEALKTFPVTGRKVKVRARASVGRKHAGARKRVRVDAVATQRKPYRSAPHGPR